MYQKICDEIKRQAGISAEIVETIKGGTKKTGITLGSGDIKPTIYPDDLRGETPQEKAAAIIAIYNRHEMPEIDLDALTSWEYARKRIYKCLRPVIETPDQITRRMLNLDVYIRLRIDDEKSVVVTRGLLKAWGITEDQLFETAETMQGNVSTMSDIMTGNTTTDYNIDHAGMLVISNDTKVNGSGVLLNNDFLDKIAQENGGTFYIIPSSIHECLCVKGDDPKFLKEMLLSVNAEALKPEERLSDTVYKYENGCLEIAA